MERCIGRTLVLPVLFAVSAVVPSAAFAQGGHLKGEKGENRRAKLEETFQQRVEQRMRTQMNLSDDQVQKLRDVNARLSARRRELGQQERATRQDLRAEVARGPAANQARVSQLMNQAESLQQQRLALQQQERQEVSTFLTPVQQAKYFGLQAKLRQRAQELVREQDGQ